MTGLTSPLCDTLGIELPIVQAPIGSAASPELVAAVGNAGGLGMLALTWVGPGGAVKRIQRVRGLSERPFGVNLVLDFPVDDTLDVCLAEGVSIISTFWGDPAAVHERIAAAGALHLHTVGSVAEARLAVDAGVDVIVAQGGKPAGTSAVR